MKRLLLVDDDKTFVLVLTAALRSFDFEVKCAYSVNEALRVLEEFTPTHCLVDLKMPGTSGLELVSHLHHTLPQARVVVLTGHASIETAINAVKLGATYYLSKPVSMEQIIEAFSKIRPSTDVKERAVVSKDLLEVEREHIEVVLIRNDYNISQSAKELGLHRRTLQRKLFKLGLDSKSLGKGE